MGVEDRSEFDGGGVMPNTVYPKGRQALTNSDKLRLQSITGQEEDSRAPVNPYFWQGGTTGPDTSQAEAREARRARAMRQQESRRYRESS